MKTTSWLIAEQFNTANLNTFRALLAADRLEHIGYCLPTGRTGEFASTSDAEQWIADGKNVYANVKTEGSL